MRDEFMITRQGKQYVLFAGLLDEAHNRGLRGIDTQLIQVPDESNGNVAVTKATVTMEDGRVFSGIGDASPNNVGRAVATALLRMAETRAKARALRDAINVGATALEELSDGGDTREEPASGSDSSPAPLQSIAGGSSRGGSRSTRTSDTAQPPRGSRARSGTGNARKSQVDLLKTLASEWRGEEGVARLEDRIGKRLESLTKQEADEWIDRLTPEEQRNV